MKLNKILSIVLGLSLVGVPISFAQDKPTQRSDWKTYVAATGEKFEVYIGTDSPLKPTYVSVYGTIDGEWTPITLDCHGHYITWGCPMCRPYSPGRSQMANEWKLADSQSLIGRMANDVCAKR